MTEKITGTIYTTVRFEALIRDREGYAKLEDVFVRYPSSVLYEVNGEEKTGTYVTMTQPELWETAIRNAQQLTYFGTAGEILMLRKKETTATVEKKTRQASLFDAVERADEVSKELQEEAAERYDNMIR